MKTINLFIFITALVSLNACSRDYSPQDTSTGESIYHTACVGCHKKDAAGMIFTLDKKNATTAYVSERIAKGNMMMPKFPNIKGEQLQQLSEYILNNSKLSI